MKIIDCFMYFDEDLVLEIRLNTLDSIVDKFVICEGTRDHGGKDKKLNFDINKFLKFKNKIQYLVVDDIPVNVRQLKKLAPKSCARSIREMLYHVVTKRIVQRIR